MTGNLCTWCYHKTAVEWGKGWAVKRFYCNVKKCWTVPCDSCSRFKEDEIYKED